MLNSRGSSIAEVLDKLGRKDIKLISFDMTMQNVEFLRKGIRNTELTRATRIAEKAWDADPKNPEKKAAFAAAYAAMNDYRASIKGECVFSMAVALRSENGQMGWDKKAALAAEVESK